MFDPFERVARAHHVCPCCERPFSPEEEDNFVKKVVHLKCYYNTLTLSIDFEQAHYVVLNCILLMTAKSEGS